MSAKMSDAELLNKAFDIYKISIISIDNRHESSITKSQIETIIGFAESHASEGTEVLCAFVLRQGSREKYRRPAHLMAKELLNMDHESASRFLNYLKWIIEVDDPEDARSSNNFRDFVTKLAQKSAQGSGSFGMGNARGVGPSYGRK
ncbi:MAG: hypothetical protein ACP5UD_07785 [Conexivisphaera sp.]